MSHVNKARVINAQWTWKMDGWTDGISSTSLETDPAVTSGMLSCRPAAAAPVGPTASHEMDHKTRPLFLHLTVWEKRERGLLFRRNKDGAEVNRCSPTPILRTTGGR